MPDLSPKEISALSDLLANLRPHLSLALAEHIRHEAALEMPDVRMVACQDIQARGETVLYTVFRLNLPLPGESLLVFSERAACVFANLIRGIEDGPPFYRLMQEQIESLAEAMATVSHGFATALTSMTGDTVGLEGCRTQLGAVTLPPAFTSSDSAVQARLTLSLPELLDGEITFLFTPEFAQALIAATVSEDYFKEPEPETFLSPDLDDLAGYADTRPGTRRKSETLRQEETSEGGADRAFEAKGPFTDLASPSSETTLPRGMELILDIPLEVTVELGRVRMLIRDVLEMASGSIVELDRVAGEPVDLLVNGRLVAKGEVVVIEDNFGIRITEIVSPADRVAGLSKGR